MTDKANIHADYAELMAEAVSDGLDHKSEPVALKQRINDWQNKFGEESLHSIAETGWKTTCGWSGLGTENLFRVIRLQLMQ